VARCFLDFAFALIDCALHMFVVHMTPLRLLDAPYWKAAIPIANSSMLDRISQAEIGK
jgi:hypothetical protein